MEVISTRRYEVRPPADSHASILVDPTNAVALVKEEEWETRKKKEITTTRQIETRVKRQVVLEDGEVVVDSGPQVTTNTTEDVEQQEHTTQERRTTGEEPQKVDWPAAAKAGALVQKELNETIVKSREEIEERLETEDRQQLGDISDEAYLQAVRNNRGDLRVSLAESKRQLSNQQHQGPRVVQHTTRSNKVVDTEKTLERSELKQDGQIVTERKTTVEHEEIKDDEAPDEIEGIPRDEVDEAHEVRKEATQRYVKRRDEDIVDYVSNGERVAREMRYVSETTEAERTGDWPSEPITPGLLRSSRIHGKHGFTTTTTTERQKQQQNHHATTSAAAAAAAAARKDALTRKPLDLEEEDEARKFETSKWLESHFGSESRSSHGSLEDEEHHEKKHHSTNTSYINVTMKSVPTTTAREHYKQTTTTTTTTKQQRRTTTNGATSPSGYFQGISQWSERYQSTEKQNNHIRSKSPQYIIESTREVNRNNNGHHQPTSAINNQQYNTRSYEATRRHQEQQQQQQQRHSPPHERPKVDPPSPPLRRKAKEQVTTTKTERSYHQESVPRAGSIERSSSPVHVVQRTWENRSRDERDHHHHQHQQQQQHHERRERTRNGELHSSSRRHHHQHRSPERTRHRPRSPASRSVSPSPVRSSSARRDDKDKNSRPSKSPSPSKYKIGESFRKLVGKLRSASSERNKNGTKRPNGSSSTSQLTQTDDGSYVQYNSVDRNIPLGPDYDIDDRPPERPPRSPRNNSSNNNNNVTTSTTHVINVRESPKMNHSSSRYRSSSSPRQHEYKETVISSSSTQQKTDQPIHRYYLGEDPYGGSIYGKEKGYKETRLHSSRHRSRPIDDVDYSMESSSLGRFSKSMGRLVNEHHQSDYERAREAQTLPRKMQNQTSSSRTTTTTTKRVTNNGSSPVSVTRYVSSSSNNNNNNNNNAINGNGYEPPRQYGSMINISFRNQVSPPKTTHFVQTSINTQPPKPEKTYKSTLSRSKSFNVEIADDGVVSTPKTRHINKLDETPPLKSPGILASINRNNNRNKLFSNGRLHDH